MDSWIFCEELKKLIRSDFLENELIELFSNLPFTLDLKDFYMFLVASEVKNFKDVLKALFSILSEEVDKKVKKARIKDFTGSRYEEEIVLRNYFLNDFLKKMPNWYKKALRNRE